jgi:hypothetical protein
MSPSQAIYSSKAQAPLSKEINLSTGLLSDIRTTNSNPPTRYSRDFFTPRQQDLLLYKTKLIPPRNHITSGSTSRSINPPLELIARLLWPAFSLQWIPKVTSPSTEVLAYIEEVPNIISIHNAGKLLRKLEALETLPKCIVPMGDGGVCIAWPLRNFYADICCGNDGENILSFRKPGSRKKYIDNCGVQYLHNLTSLIKDYL